MASRRIWVLAPLTCSLWLSPTMVAAAEYYVATTGNDSNDGTMAAPFATLQKGADTASAGDTVFIRGGIYNVTTPKTSSAGITFTKSGSSENNRIKFWAYEGEAVVFDFSNMTLSTSGYTHGFVVTGSWLHFRGIEIRNVKMNTRSNNAIAVNGGGYNIFELMDLHHNAGTGIFIGKGQGGHLILNSDAHDNYDPTSTQGDGQNADGFGVHYQTEGPSTILRGCRAWWNSDDGYDLISQEVPVIIESSYAMGNGFANSGMDRPADGNGNGFKVGSSKTGIRHVVRNNLAWGNRAAGFYANHSSGGNDWFNNTSYDNGTQYNMLASTWDADGNRTDGVTLTGARVHRMRNNIGFPDDNTYMNGVDTAFNTWDLMITPAVEDFVSVVEEGALGPRQPDGSLPDVDFMKLRAGSPLVDRGTDVGLPSVGAGPDLGAFEHGATVSGGGAGAGGAPVAAGAPGVGGSVSTSGSGGITAIGGSLSSSGSGGTAAMPAGGASLGAPLSAEPVAGPGPDGCACRITGARSSLAGSVALVSLLTAIGLRRARRSRNRAT